MMKKAIALLLTALLSIPFCGCGKKTQTESSAPANTTARRTLNIGAGYDESAVLIADMLKKNEQKKLSGEYLISLFDSSDKIAEKLRDQILDAALLPAGVAIATAKAGGGNLRVCAELSGGNLFAVTKTTDITDIEGFKSKKIGILNTFNEKAVLSDLFTVAGIAANDVTLDTFKTAADLKKAAKASDYDILVAAEPYAAMIAGSNEQYAFRLDLGDFWKSAHGEDLPGILLVVSNDCAAVYPKEIADLKTDLKTSLKAVSSDKDRVAELIKDYGVSEELSAAKQSVEATHADYIEKTDLSKALKSYLGAVGDSFGVSESELDCLLLN